MTSDRSTSRITDVVPANFLCDSRAIERIAESQLNEERVLDEVEEDLSVLEARRRCLEDELATVDQLIDDAVVEQTRLRSYIATHRSLLSSSPVRALPGEVLSEIFLHYIALSQTAQDDVFKEIVASHCIHTPILLVCRRWRTTALADARLWTTIPLVGSGDGGLSSFSHPLVSKSPRKRAAYWKALECRIQRTSALPLQLLFYFYEGGAIRDPMYAVSSLQTFIRLFPRADTISLDIQDSKNRIPELRSTMDEAEIPHTGAVHNARVHVNHEFGRKVLSAIPNVEVLETSGQHFDAWFIGAPTAGHRLRSLHLLNRFSLPISQVLDLLDRAPLLETLKVHQISVASSIVILRVVTHMRLSTFHLASATTDENDAVFSHITLPVLRALSYGGNVRTHLWPRPTNMAFFQRSGCMLESLAFSRCQVDERCLLEMLTAQKALVTLQLNFNAAEGEVFKAGPIPNAIIQFLSSNSSDHPLPALTFLTVLVLPRQLRAMRRLVQSRSAEKAKKCRIAALREVHIQVYDDLNDVSDDDSYDDSDADLAYDSANDKKEHADLFKDFASNGISIRISYERGYQL